MDDDKLKTNDPKALAVIEKYSLVSQNPVVIEIASRLHWRPTTVIARVERALPAKFEQVLYLTIAGDFRIQPETMSKILDAFYGRRDLIELDMGVPRQVGENLLSNTFGNFADFLMACMNLLKVVVNEYNAFSMTIEQAAIIVAAYGEGDPERIIEMIDSDLDYCCEVLNIGQKRSESERMRLCVWVFITQVLPWNRERGLPDLVDIEDYAQHCKTRERCYLELLFLERDTEQSEIRQANQLMVDLRPLGEIINELKLRFPASNYDHPEEWWRRAKSTGHDRVEQGNPVATHK